MTPNEELCVSLLGRYDQGKVRRANWESGWNDVAAYVLPRKRDTVRQPSSAAVNGPASAPVRFDTTATNAVRVCAGGLLSSLTPAGELWFRFNPSNPGVSSAVKSWLDDCTHRAAEALTASNFYLSIHECLLDLSAFSLEGLFIEEGLAFQGAERGELLNFVQVPVGTFTIEEDAEQRVDTVFRTFFWSARQCAQKWGEERLSKEMREALASKDPAAQTRQFEIVQAIYPRRTGEFVSGPAIPDKRPVASVYIDVASRHIIENGGFYEMPVAVARLLREDNMIYGTGPADEVMPEVRMVNAMRRSFLLALEQQSNPQWLGPNDGSWRPDNRPGGIIYWDTSDSKNKPERLRDTARLDFIDPAIADSRQIIRQAWFNDMFQMLNRPEVLEQKMTAFQVAEMTQEKLLLFSPMFARITRELLTPALTRVFNVLLRREVFEPVPEDVNLGELSYQIDYVSRIALAIRQAQTGALAQTAQMLGAMAQFDPLAAHVIKWPKAGIMVARNAGVPAEIIRDEDELAAIQQEQQQAQRAAQLAQMAGAANQAAGAVQKLGPDAQRAATDAIGGAS
ncbi:Bacteriophage head to tail connecting protein [Opitutaceae bacterium TAV1]|nr:Bacteriophage head to tail connecting protein [Opitutaceae bacterium TAV1]